MGKYTCERCGTYTTDSRQNFWTHQNKTKKCGRNRTPANTKITPPEHQITPTNTNIIPNKKQCKYCNKIFSRVDSKTRHEKGRCKVKKEQDRQRLEQAQLSQTINNTTNNNNNTTNNIQNNNIQNNNIQNNITVVAAQPPLLNAFLKQNMNIVDKQMEIERFIHKNLDHIEGGEGRCLENTDTALKGFIMLVQMMFFDPGHPENHMIKGKEKSKNAKVYDGERFISRVKVNAFMQVADIAFTMIDNSIKHGMLNHEDGFAAFNRVQNYKALKRLWRQGTKAQRKHIYNAIDLQLQNRTPPPKKIADKVVRTASRFKDYKRCIERTAERSRQIENKSNQVDEEDESSEFDSGTDVSIIFD